MSTLLLVSQTVAAKTQTMVVNTESSTLALRENGPGTRVKCRLRKGTEVVTESTQKMKDSSGVSRWWVKVNVPSQPNCGIGWMASQYLKKTQEEKTMVANTKSSSSRSQPTSTSAARSDSQSGSTVSLSTPICGCSSCYMSSGFGWREWSDGLHRAHDYAMKETETETETETKVFAMADATVVKVGGGCPRSNYNKQHDQQEEANLHCNGRFGNYVTLRVDKSIKDRNGTTYQPPIYIHYAHLRKDGLIENGMSVKRGDSLGFMGNSGFSTNDHLDVRILNYKDYDGVKQAHDDLKRRQLNELLELASIKTTSLQGGHPYEKLEGEDFVQVKDQSQPLLDLTSSSTESDIEKARESVKRKVGQALKELKAAYNPSLFFISDYSDKDIDGDGDIDTDDDTLQVQGEINSTLTGPCPRGYDSAPPQRGNNQERSVR